MTAHRRSRPGAIVHKKFIIKFVKGIDKCCIVWYNIYTKEREVNTMAIIVLGLILLVGVGYFDSFHRSKKEEKEEENEKVSKIL